MRGDAVAAGTVHDTMRYLVQVCYQKTVRIEIIVDRDARTPERAGGEVPQPGTPGSNHPELKIIPA